MSSLKSPSIVIFLWKHNFTLSNVALIVVLLSVSFYTAVSCEIPNKLATIWILLQSFIFYFQEILVSMYLAILETLKTK